MLRDTSSEMTENELVENTGSVTDAPTDHGVIADQLTTTALASPRLKSSTIVFSV